MELSWAVCGACPVKASHCDAACFELAPIYLRAFPSEENGWTCEPCKTVCVQAALEACFSLFRQAALRGVAAHLGHAGCHSHLVQDKCRKKHRVITEFKRLLDLQVPSRLRKPLRFLYSAVVPVTGFPHRALGARGTSPRRAENLSPPK